MDDSISDTADSAGESGPSLNLVPYLLAYTPHAIRRIARVAHATGTGTGSGVTDAGASTGCASMSIDKLALKRPELAIKSQ